MLLLGAQMLRTTRPFAQWNLISRTYNIPNIGKARKKEATCIKCV